MLSSSENETKEFGKQLAAKLSCGDIVLLEGELGAGKTTLVKGIAEGLGIKDGITSPTFTLMNVYKINNEQLTINKLVHIDTYRLKNEQELLDIGAEDYLGKPDTVCIVEWPEKIQNLLKYKKTIAITMAHAEGNQRKITTSL